MSNQIKTFTMVSPFSSNSEETIECVSAKTLLDYVKDQHPDVDPSSLLIRLDNKTVEDPANTTVNPGQEVSVTPTNAKGAL